MITDESIHLTGPYGDDYRARAVFGDFDEDGVPAMAALQVEDEDGQWNTVRTFNSDDDAALVEAYWAGFQAWAAEDADEDLADQRRAA